MSIVRRVAGKDPRQIFSVSEDLLPDGSRRTRVFEGSIRHVPGRMRHTGGFRSPFDHHGHLIADEFGGPETAESGNIVPMHGHQNAGAGGEYRAMERQVKQWLGDNDANMRVECEYKGPDDIRPHAFNISVQFSNGMHSRWRIFNFNPHLPNPYR